MSTGDDQGISAQETAQRFLNGDGQCITNRLVFSSPFLENHGALVRGATLPEAYIYHHFFELACRAQVGALSGRAEPIAPRPEICEERARKFERVGVYDSKSRDWVAAMALVEKLCPDYKR
jgi:ribulose-5-phosphate 4-epimerase/fuculose-1-phosphate aldolase